MIEIIILVIGLIIAFTLGYYIGKSNKFSSNDLSQQTGLVSQISEMKGMFAEIEKSRHRAEDMRDAQIQDMRNMMTTFTQTISGTKTRGMVGESILSEVLSNSIKAGVIKKELKIGSQNVEFAWDLGDGKYIPIDSKLPDVFSLVDQFEKSTFGIIPQQLRGGLSNFSNNVMYGECFNKFIGCALKIIDAFKANK